MQERAISGLRVGLGSRGVDLVNQSGMLTALRVGVEQAISEPRLIRPDKHQADAVSRVGFPLNPQHGVGARLRRACGQEPVLKF